VAESSKDSQESLTQVVQVNGIDRETVQSMVDCIYSAAYQINHNPRPDSIPKLQRRERLKDKYGEEKDTPVAGEAIDINGNHQSLRHMATFLKDDGALVRCLCVNGIADYYNIPKLAALARSNLYSLLRDNKLPLDLFPSFLAEVFRIIGNSKLYKLIALVTMDNADKLLAMASFMNMDLLSDFLMDIISEAMF
jgi:hypothetical protein